MTPAPPGTRRSSFFLRSVSGSAVERLPLELEQVEQRRAPECPLPPGATRSASGPARRARRSRRRARRRTSGSRVLAARATSRNRSVRSLPFRLVNVTSPPETRHDRAEAVPLRLVQPALAGRHRLRGDGEHRFVAPALRPCRRPCAAMQPVLLVAVEAAPERASTRRRGARPAADRQPPVSLLLEQLVGARVPDLDRPRAVFARRDDTLEVPVPERMILDVHREMPLALARAGRPSAPPSSRARRLARAGSRSGASWRRGVGSRTAGPSSSGRRCRTARASCPARACAGTRRGSPVDCRPKRNMIFTNGCMCPFLPAQSRFRAGDKPVEAWGKRRSDG